MKRGLKVARSGVVLDIAYEMYLEDLQGDPMAAKIAVVDAFTSEVFSGNPAGVCLLEQPGEDGWMQLFAAEMRHSETAFLVPLEVLSGSPADTELAIDPDSWRNWMHIYSDPVDGANYLLRWFTPATEVDLCGHATLASSHLLHEQGIVDPGVPIRFHTRSGLLTITREGDRLKMDFPALPVRADEPVAGLLEALGVRDAVVTGMGGEDHFVQLASADDVRALEPDFDALEKTGGRGVLVTAPGDNGYDAVSRGFFPQVGIDEDPATGSAHCVIGPYWAKKLGKDEVRCYQASERGGEITVRVHGDRVDLLGQAVTVFAGVLGEHA